MRAQSSWDILGVSRNCSKSDVKVAYRRLMLQVHPDLHSGDVSKTKQAVLLNEAYVDVIAQLSMVERRDNDVFSSSGDEDPEVLFVNPLLCNGVPHIYWYDLQILAQELGEAGFQMKMMESEGIRIPDQAFIYLTKSQHLALMNELENSQNELDYVSTEALEYHLIDCLSRAQRANR